MKLRMLLSSVSLACLALAVAEASARAQEVLPAIDVGAAQPFLAAATAMARALAQARIWRRRIRRRWPGAGPYNPTYVLEDASVGTKTDTPVMDTR